MQAGHSQKHSSQSNIQEKDSKVQENLFTLKLYQVLKAPKHQGKHIRIRTLYMLPANVKDTKYKPYNTLSPPWHGTVGSVNTGKLRAGIFNQFEPCRQHF